MIPPSMIASPLELPEVLNLVRSFVKDPSDVQSCRQVNRQWHDIFAPYFWWTVLMLGFRSMLDKRHDRFDRRPIKHKQRREEAEAQKRQFHGTFCDEVLGYSSWLEKVGREVSMNSFSGLVLLAGRRSDLTILQYVIPQDAGERTIFLPRSVLPEALNGEEWTNAFKSLFNGKIVSENKPVALDTALDLVLAIIKQNRGLKTLKIGKPMPNQYWSWSSRVSIPNDGLQRRWWPCLQKIHIQHCSLRKDFLCTVLDNTERLEHLWLTGVNINESDDLNEFGSSTTSLRTLGLCRVIGVPLWTQLDFARAQTRLEELTISAPLFADFRLGKFLRLGESASVVVDDSYQPPVPTFQHLWRLNIFMTTPPLGAQNSQSELIKVGHITNSISTATISTSSMSSTSTSSSAGSLPGLRRLELFSSQMDPREMRTIVSRHCASLESIELKSVGISGYDVLLILQRCSRLQRLCAECVPFRYDICYENNRQHEYDLTQPWTCQDTLKDLTISLLQVFETRVDLDEKGQEFSVLEGQKRALNRQEQFLFRLGTLVKLQFLQLNTNENLSSIGDAEADIPSADDSSTMAASRSFSSDSSFNGYTLDQSLDLCLSKGLGHLVNLKQLQVLDLRTATERVAYSPAFIYQTSNSPLSNPSSTPFVTSRAMRSAGVQEAEWVASHWPQLRVVKGLGHPQSAFMTRLRSLREGVIESTF